MESPGALAVFHSCQGIKMRSKSINYKTADAPGWMHKCDDLFLAQFRGKPCEICGAVSSIDNGRVVQSCGHHLIFKGRCRKFRYQIKNIVVLCPYHHSHFVQDIGPHSMVNTMAQKNFGDWMQKKKPGQFKWWKENEEEIHKAWDRSWTYREKYEELGGEIHSKTGLIKDLKPYKHAAALRRIKENGS